MFCLRSARPAVLLTHSVLLLIALSDTASSNNDKDSSDGREDLQVDAFLQGPSGQAAAHRRVPGPGEELAQWWGEWSSWSTCSRTCGGGVRSQERHCLQQRLSSAHNINSSFCVGSPKQYQLCPSQPCPSSRVSFKQQQCSQFNSKAFGRRHYEWVPLYPDDYISISNKPCDLQCTTSSGERQLLVPAHDGTYCRDGAHQGVCIEGHCQPVGCDGLLYSSKTVDMCGVCGGHGASCQRVSGIFRRGTTHLGYVFITNIPAGASDIQIIERRKTENILALSDEAGHFFFNGNSVIDNPRNFRVAGTVFKYRRPSTFFSEGLEYIIAQGPTNLGINLMYNNLNGKMPHITYEYTVPSHPAPRTATPLHQASLDSSLFEPAPGDTLQGTLETRPSQSHAPHGHAPHGHAPNGNAPHDTPTNSTSSQLSSHDNEIDVMEDLEKLSNNNATQGQSDPQLEREGAEPEKEGLDEDGDWLEGDRREQPDLEKEELDTEEEELERAAAILFYRPASDVIGDIITHNDLQDQERPVPAGYRTDSNLIDSNTANPNATGPAKPLPHHRSLIMDLFLSPGPPGHAPRPPPCPESPAPCSVNQLNASSGLNNRLVVEAYAGSLDLQLHGPPEDASSPYGLLYELQPNSTQTLSANQLNLHEVLPVQGPSTESNEFEVGSLEQDISLADMYRWKISAYAPCSSTCTTGISTSYALCVRYDGTEVDEAYCDALTRPEPTHEFCTGKDCLPRWESSRWSECSRTCGEGFQFRTVRCWKMMSPGLDSSVYDDLCEGAELHKPMSRKACRSSSCGPQWEVSDWSECSARCGGRGLSRREVRCSMETRLCNDSSRPISEKECEGPPCDRRWTVSDWGPCSGVCGEGRMTRYVVCKTASGSSISEDQCDHTLRPLAVQPCGGRTCPAHWVEQEWEQCNATCGRGVRVRQVVCAGLEEGVFKGYPEQSCDSSPRPQDSSACFQRPCSKWFTTSWSQCSKTCGSGVRVREVKCYQGEELGHSCDSALKPEARQTCEVLPCPTDAPAAEDQCQDKVTATCGLVLKVRLCSHWYYRKVCCQSCHGRGP
ncbi:ADAMTS-like protein 2 isoform X2 [Osmerus eperlanus]|uniref:ADAMTS-like protein 2 isoform X2 n=1 Tax=Osmerus eperlanus TaxID=29151 RepID=UPI002E1558C1